MALFTLPAAAVFAFFNADGTPRQPGEGADKWGTEVERAINGLVASGARVFATKASIDSSLAHPADAMGWVVADSNPALNGIYKKFGASGSGYWQRLGPLPTGEPGPPGEDGTAFLTGTSLSTVEIGAGEKNFTIVEEERGWGVGARLRASSATIPYEFMEGTVTSYSGTSLALDVDNPRGTGNSYSSWVINIAGEPGDVTQELFDLRDEAQGFRNESEGFRDQAEDARDVAIARSTGPIAPPWHGALTYLAGERVGHSGLVYHALQPSIGIEPGSSGSAAYWAPDTIFNGVMKPGVPASWPAGMQFITPVAQSNLRPSATPSHVIDLNNTTPGIGGGTEWLTGTWTPKAGSTYIRYRVHFTGTVFAVAAGDLVLSLFAGSAHIGSTAAKLAAGEYKPIRFHSADLAAPSGATTISLRAGNGAAGGTTFRLNGNDTSALFFNGAHASLEVSERVIQP